MKMNIELQKTLINNTIEKYFIWKHGKEQIDFWSLCCESGIDLLPTDQQNFVTLIINALLQYDKKE